LHPDDPFLDDLGDGPAVLALGSLGLEQLRDKRRRVETFERIDLAAGILSREGFGIVDPSVALRCLPVAVSVNLKAKVATPAVVMLT
jgi:hypothetical protein